LCFGCDVQFDNPHILYVFFSNRVEIRRFDWPGQFAFSITDEEFTFQRNFVDFAPDFGNSSSVFHRRTAPANQNAEFRANSKKIV